MNLDEAKEILNKKGFKLIESDTAENKIPQREPSDKYSKLAYEIEHDEKEGLNDMLSSYVAALLIIDSHMDYKQACHIIRCNKNPVPKD
jgi:hypothetical protein